MNGWTEWNGQLRQCIVQGEYLDIVLLTETHWIRDHKSEIVDYVCFHNNRKGVHKDAKKGSGGVAIMIKNEILENHKVSIIDKEIDGILGIELVNRLSGFQSVYFCCYLSPENSVWGRDSDSFFAHLTTQVYLHQDCDLILIGGDFNARIGSEDDYINEIDEVKTRCNIDEVKSGHGEAFIEFLKEARTIVLNGRLNVENDNFTSTSTRGKAVVDYLITTHDRLSLCENFRVKLMSDLINEHGLEAHINDTCKAPDHSLLTV